MGNSLWTTLFITLGLGTLHAETVRICYIPGTAVMHFLQARGIVERIYQKVDIHFEWRMKSDKRSCAARTIVISLEDHTPSTLLPDALAYARPYEGTHIVLLFDRITAAAEPRQVDGVLAHVIAHELGHMLQAVARHSDQGIMKARWTRDDFRLMNRRPLEFTAADIRLLHAGIAAGANPRMASAAVKYAPTIQRTESSVE